MRTRRDYFSPVPGENESGVLGNIAEHVASFVTTAAPSLSSIQDANSTLANATAKPISLLQAAARGFSHEVHLSRDVKMPVFVFALLGLAMILLGTLLFMLCCLKRGTEDPKEGEEPTMMNVTSTMLYLPQPGTKKALSHRSAIHATNKKSPTPGTNGRPGGPVPVQQDGDAAPGGACSTTTSSVHASDLMEDASSTVAEDVGRSWASSAAAEAEKGLGRSMTAAPSVAPEPKTITLRTPSPVAMTMHASSSRRVGPPPPPAIQEKPKVDFFKTVGGDTRKKTELLKGSSPELQEKLLKRHQGPTGEAEKQTPDHDGTDSRHVLGQSAFKERWEAAQARDMRATTTGRMPSASTVASMGSPTAAGSGPATAGSPTAAPSPPAGSPAAAGSGPATAGPSATVSQLRVADDEVEQGELSACSDRETRGALPGKAFKRQQTKEQKPGRGPTRYGAAAAAKYEQDYNGPQPT